MDDATTGGRCAAALDDVLARAARGAGLLAAGRDAGSAVLVPLVGREEGPAVVLEVRAATLATQPGEVCLPGGAVEPGEPPAAAAARECREELLLGEGDVEVVASLGDVAGPGSRPLHAFVGRLARYEGTFSPAEVARTFELPVASLLARGPLEVEVPLEPRFPADMPWRLVPGGRSYAWRWPRHLVPFYEPACEGDPVVWGATARVLMAFAEAVRAGGEHGAPA